MVNKFLYPRGGAETYFLKIGQYFTQQGHEVQYFGMYDEKNTVGNNAGEYTQNMDFHDAGMEKLLYPFKIIYSFEARKKISKVIRDFKPDVIHMNNINFQLTPSIIDAAHKYGVPVVQTVHDYQMVCPNHLLYDINTKKNCELCLGKGKLPCIKKRCIHGSLLKSVIGYFEALLYKYRSNYKKVSEYICPSAFLEEKLLTNDVFKGKTSVIHNFIELDDIPAASADEDYVLFFGRLSEEKGIDIFLKACSELGHIKFKIAGTGPMEEMCRGFNNIEFVGFKTGDELKKLIANAKFSVYPSIWYENCPLSILESISLGTPVITTGWGGMKELVEDGVTGKLVTPMNEENLYAAIEELYSSEQAIAEMSKNCISARDAMITLDKYCRVLEGIYKKALKKDK